LEKNTDVDGIVPTNGTNPIISVGLIIDASEKSIDKWATQVKKFFELELAIEFPQFSWCINIIERHDFPKQIPRDPLVLLEFGSDLKIEYGFDFVLVLTCMPLKSRFEQGINAVPSSMLETAVVSFAKLAEEKNKDVARNAVISLLKHVLGHIWGLDHNEETVMKPRKFWSTKGPTDWNEKERKKVADFLKEVADPRLEETDKAARNVWHFYMQVIMHEVDTLIKDIFSGRSLLMMFHLGRFIAATAVSITFLFLSAEAWEIGAAIRSAWLDLVLLIVIIFATLSLYYGQNFHKLSRSDKMMEQAVRSRIVLFGTLLVGMFAFWTSLFLISCIIIYLLPDKVISGWAGLENETLSAIHYGKLMATFGILASAVGGNLEQEHDIKAVLVFTEET